MKKASVENLIALAESRKTKGFVSKEIEVPEIGMSFTVVKQPLINVLKVIDGLDESTMSGKLDSFKMLIYTCVPLFRDEKVQLAYECSEPSDIVTKVMDDNLNAIATLGQAIIELYGLADGGAINQIKN